MLAVIEIPWRHQAVARTSHEGALYAALDVIGGGNPALAQAIHDASTPPPFSAHLDSGLLRIGCLTTDVFLAVAGSRLAYKATRAREDSFETILARAQGRPRTVRLTFISPTSFSASTERGVTHTLPDTAHVFGALTRRWRAAGGPEVPDLLLGAAAVTYAVIATRKTHLERYTVYGFTGRLTYRAPEGLAAWYHALADFAEYAGVGQRTSQGFGRVTYEQPERSDQRQPPGTGVVPGTDVRQHGMAQGAPALGV